jgi:hypothetical protein
MFKTILNSLPIASTSKDEGTGHENKPVDQVNVHAMWYQKDDFPRATSRDQTLQKNLIAAYVETASSAHSAPPNVETHLWTDRKSLHSLYMPYIDVRGSTIEIPHSMLARMPVNIHLDKELEKLIDMVEDKAIRDVLHQFHRQGAAVNIGFRSNVARVLYCYLYSAKEKDSTHAEGGKLNFHVDIDTLAAIRELLARPRTRRRVEFESGGIENAKATWKAMGKEMEGLRPPKPQYLFKTDLAKLADTPQKSWSLPDQDNRVQGAPVKIPHEVLKRGRLARSGENDVIAMVPGHEKALDVAKNTLSSVEKWPPKKKWWLSLPNPYEERLKKYASRYHQLDEHAAEPLSSETAVDYLRLAQRIVGLKPNLEQKISDLQATIANPGSTPDERNIAVMRVKAIHLVYDLSRNLVFDFDNYHSYLPQVRGTSEKGRQILAQFSKTVFGVTPPRAETGSWKGAPLENDCPDKVDRNSKAFSAVQRTVFKEIKKMLRGRTDDDIEIEYSTTTNNAPDGMQSSENRATDGDDTNETDHVSPNKKGKKPVKNFSRWPESGDASPSASGGKSSSKTNLNLPDITLEKEWAEDTVKKISAAAKKPTD